MKLFKLAKECQEEINLFLKLRSSTKNERVLCFAVSSLARPPPTLRSAVCSGTIPVNRLSFEMKNPYLNT